MIALAPHHKAGLALANPVMTVAGCYGLGTEYAGLLDTGPLGAVVVGPVTVEPRQGAGPPRLMPVPGGVLLHTGLDNPGIARVVREFGRAWRQMSVPVIVHVAGTSLESVSRCCSRLSTIDAVGAIEVGVTDNATPDQVRDIIGAADASAIQPLLARLPLAGAIRLCEAAVEAGADALTVAGPPRGTVWYPPQHRFVTGALYGPFVFPLVLNVLQAIRSRVTVPIVGCGGVSDAEDASALLHAGCVAVQIGAAIWRDPLNLSRIARALAA